jgi:hypothetical protein
MYPVTHLLVNALNPQAGPVVPPAVRRAPRRPRFRRRVRSAPAYRYPLRAP